eukprot:gb/GECG01009433.1/.p1 GENE.gb/GECG01009433.1/~~gb/GECG01009433.1/.p1  ORF type:complete len:175 (+),score=24.54 gb/GECG01009433.1/:1-525(+)
MERSATSPATPPASRVSMVESSSTSSATASHQLAEAVGSASVDGVELLALSLRSVFDDDDDEGCADGLVRSAFLSTVFLSEFTVWDVSDNEEALYHVCLESSVVVPSAWTTAASFPPLCGVKLAAVSTYAPAAPEQHQMDLRKVQRRMNSVRHIGYFHAISASSTPSSHSGATI